MSASQIALGVVIGGIVSSSFGSSLKNVDSSLTKYQDKIKSLNKDKLILKAQNDPKNAAAISSINQQLLALRKSAKIRIALESKKEDLIAQKNSLLAVLGTAYVLSTPIKAQLEIEQSQGEIASLGIDEKGIAVITKSAKEFSNTFAGTTTSDFIKASYDIKSGIASLTDEGVAQFTKLSAMTATATKATTGEMTKLFALGYGIYKEQFSNDFEFGEKFSAAISKSVQAFRTDGADLSAGLSTLGAVATKLGVSLEEQLSIIGNAKGAFNSASEAATSYRAFLGSVGKAQEKLGITMTDATGKMLPMNQILKNLKDNMGDLTEVSNMDTLKNAFGSDEAVKIITALIDKNEDLVTSQKEINEAMNQGSSVTEKMAQAMQKGKGFELLGQQINNLGATIGKIFMPAATLLASTIGGIVGVLGSTIETFPVVSSVVGGLALGMFALVAVTKLATVTKTLFSMAFLTTKGVLMGYPIILSVLKVSYLALGSALKLAGTSALWLGRALMANPIGLAIGAIVMGATLIYTYWEPIKGFFSNLWIGIKGFFNDGLNVIKNIFSFSPLGLVFNSFEPIKGFFSGFWDGIKGLFDDGLNVIKNIFSFSPLEIIKNAWSGVFDWFSAKFDFVLNGIEKLKNMGANVKDFFTFGSDKKSEDKTEVKKEVKNTEILKNAGDGKTVALGTGYTQALENSVNNSNYKTSNTNYTNNTSNNKKSESSTVVVNINNPTVQTKEQVKALEQDIKKAVDVALKEKERSNMNRTFKDVA